MLSQADLRYLRAVAVSMCELSGWNGFANLDLADDSRDTEVLTAISTRIPNVSPEAFPPGAVAWLKSVLGANEAALLRSCPLRTVDVPTPTPVPIPQPTPTPIEREDAPAYRTIAVVNMSSASSTQINKWHYAWAWQLENQYTPEYGPAEIFVGEPGPTDIRHEILDTADIPAGGYHTVDANGNPIARTFLDSGNPSGVGSHENVEVLRNSWVMLWILLTLLEDYWDEIADPVQSIFYPAPNGELVSDFILPAWKGHWGEFNPRNLHAAAKYANLPVLSQRLQIAPGGYMGKLNRNTGVLDYVFGQHPVLPGANCAIRHSGMVRRLQEIDPKIHLACAA